MAAYGLYILIFITPTKRHLPHKTSPVSNKTSPIQNVASQNVSSHETSSVKNVTSHRTSPITKRQQQYYKIQVYLVFSAKIYFYHDISVMNTHDTIYNHHYFNETITGQSFFWAMNFTRFVGDQLTRVP